MKHTTHLTENLSYLHVLHIDHDCFEMTIPKYKQTAHKPHIFCLNSVDKNMLCYSVQKRSVDITMLKINDGVDNFWKTLELLLHISFTKKHLGKVHAERIHI